MEKKIIQITSGKGPVECERAVAKVMEKMIAASRVAKILLSKVDAVNGQLPDGYFSVTLLVEGNKVKDFCMEWEGTIMWIAQSPYRKFHKRKNWYVGISVYELSSKSNFQECDIRFQTMRSSGSGGQHVNKVETAVRAIHIPSGKSVVVSNERSQLMNKKLAVKKLKAKFDAESIEFEKVQIQSKWLEHHVLERGNPIRTFKESLV